MSRRSSNGAALLSSIKPVDYSSGSVRATDAVVTISRRGSGGAFAFAPAAAAASAAPSSVVLGDAHIPLPTDPDPDIDSEVGMFSPSPIPHSNVPDSGRKGSVGARSSFGAPSPQSSGAGRFSTLPTHSRQSFSSNTMTADPRRSPGKSLLSHARTASMSLSHSAVGGGRSSPLAITPDFRSAAVAPVGISSAAASSAAALAPSPVGSPSASPRLKPLLGLALPASPGAASSALLSFPPVSTTGNGHASASRATYGTAGNPIAAVAASKAPAASATGKPSEPLLPASSVSASSAASGFFRSLAILLCCCMSPSRYAMLQSAALELRDRRRQRAASSAGGTAHFASYVGSTRSARSQARDRHLHRQSRLREAAAATKQQAAQQHRQISAGSSASEAEAAASIMAAAAEALEAARAEDAQRSLLLGRSSSNAAAGSASSSLRVRGDSDSEDEDSAAAELREAAEEAQAEELDRRYAQSRGPCCERACFPSGCYRCCPTPLTDCCTVRRGVCVSVWIVMIVSATLFLLYYCLVVQAHGWRWPPSTDDD